MEHRLHFFEGIPGTGKTTRSDLLKDALTKDGIDAVCFRECEKNDLDLARCAIISRAEYETLLKKIGEKFRGDTQKANEIIKKLDSLTRFEGGDAFVAFQTLYEDTDTDSIAYGLSSRDVYNGHYPFSFFREAHLKRWSSFADTSLKTNAVYICDAVLFQSPMFELIGYYDMSEADIVRYISELLSCVNDLNPIIHYIRVSDVASFMKQTCEIRKDDPSKWERGFYKWMESAPYFQRRNYHGFDGMCTFLSERQDLELAMLNKLGVPFSVYERSLTENEHPEGQ